MDLPDIAQIDWRSNQPIVIPDVRKFDRDKLIAEARKRAGVPEHLEDAFFFRVLASNANLDSYFTRMADTSLTNFREDAIAGVQFQNSHNGAGLFTTGSVGFGRSLFADLTGRAGARQTEIDFFTIPGLASGDMTSDQFIRGAEAGIYKDVSVGFTPGRFECSICGGDPTDWLGDCSHYPGMTYQINRKDQLAFAWIHDARLNEVSIVYDGATPGAGIIAIEKARVDAERGVLTHTAADLLEQRYRGVSIRRPTRRYAGVTMGNAQNRTTVLTDQNESVEDYAALQESRATAAAVTTPPANPESATEPVVAPVANRTELIDPNAPEPLAPAEARFQALRGRYEGVLVRQFSNDPVEALDTVCAALVTERQALANAQPLIQAGERFRADVVEAIHVEGVRAFGADKYDKDFWTEQTKRMTIDQAIACRDQFATKALERFPNGGDGNNPNTPVTIVTEKPEGPKRRKPAGVSNLGN